jgi:hypothetical protein
MSRAGLVSFILFSLFIGLATAAPLAERLSSLAERYDAYDNDFIARSLAILGDREFEIAGPEYTKREYLSIFDDREFDVADDEYTKRDYDLSVFEERDFEELEYTKRDDSDVHMLYRRRSIFTKIRDAFRKAGRAIKKGFQKVGAGLKKAGHAIKSGFQKAGHAMKAGFQKAGKALKKGFQKVGKFIKTTGAKIAKFGLKLVAAAASVASKVLKFIPGVGTALSMAVKGVAIGANAASNKIHANLGKLGKVDKGLDYVISPMGSAAKAAGKGSKAMGVVSSLLF